MRKAKDASQVLWNAHTLGWHVRRFDTIGVVTLETDTGMFKPHRLGVEGPDCPTLAGAVAWIEKREAKQGAEQP